MERSVSRNAFTMIELVFVIVVIGILGGIAIPKFAATRDDAIIAKARTTVAAVRSTLAMERQKRILRGDFNTTLQWPSYNRPVLAIRIGGDDINLTEYPAKVCPSGGTTPGCWERKSSAGQFTFYGPGNETCNFSISGFKFNPDDTSCSIDNLKNL